MQPSYLDKISANRQTQTATRQITESQQKIDDIIDQLKQGQLAQLMGNKIRPGQSVRQTKLFESIAEFLETEESKQDAENHKEVIDTLSTIKTAIQLVPDAADANAKDLKQAMERVAEALGRLKLTPNITVPQPKVVITEKDIDFTPLQETIRQAMDRPEPESKAPELPDPADLNRYRAQDLSEIDNGDIQYVGFVNPEGYWYIIENDVKANKMRYVFGYKAYSKHFKQASSYKYQLLDKAIRATA